MDELYRFLQVCDMDELYSFLQVCDLMDELYRLLFHG